MPDNICLQDTEWREEKPPEEKDERWVTTYQWHSFSVGSFVWVLYQPPLSQINDWRDFPDELEGSAVVRCEILGFGPFWKVDPRGLWRPDIPARHTPIRLRVSERSSEAVLDVGGTDFSPEFEVQGPTFVRCHEIVPLADIPRSFPEEQEIFEIPDFSWTRRRMHEMSCGSERLIYEGRGVEDNMAWWVRTREAPSRVVLFASEIMGEGHAQICNREFRQGGDT